MKFVAASLALISVVALMACSSDPHDRPDAARDLITDEQLEAFEEAGMTIYGGDTPPSIAGTYYFGDPNIEFNTSDAWPASSEWCHSLTTYQTTSRSDTYSVSYTFPNCDGGGDGQSAYIAGSGDCFTLYSELKGTFFDCYQEEVGLVSACLADNGDLVDIRQGVIVTHSDDSAACASVISDGRVMATGDMAITSQAEGFARRVE